MRLICPNCSAQYEVDSAMIPDEGRDVQCSNCGHTWFELPAPPAGLAEATPEPATEPEPATRNAPEPADDRMEPERQAAAEAASADEPGSEKPAGKAPVEETPGEATDDAAPEESVEGWPDKDEWDRDEPSLAARAIRAASRDPDDEDEDEDDDWPAPPEPEATPKPEAEPETAAEPEKEPEQRRPVEATALSVLREEAQRELAQRREPKDRPKTEPIETQTEMGLDDLRNRKTPSRALRARMAHLQDDEDTAKAEDDGYRAPRRDLLPDIDEINSSLQPGRDAAAADPDAIAETRRGFRLGFVSMIVLAAALILAYAQAPTIAATMPGTETALLRYVDAANGVRDWIDHMIGG